MGLATLVFLCAISPGDCESGRSAFESSVYKKLQRDCAGCHGGVGPGPSFATGDASASYYAVLNHVKFDDIDGSTLSIRAGNFHCKKANCNTESGKEMREQIRLWWEEGQKNCAVEVSIYSPEIELPDSLPTGTQPFTVMNWNLEDISTDLAGYSLAIEVKRQALPTELTPGAYHFRKPRIVGPGGSIRIRNLSFFVNRKMDTMARNFTLIRGDFSPVAAGSDQYPLLSADSQIVVQQTKEDRISLGFDALEITQAAGCPDRVKFEPVAQQLNLANCKSCHADANHSAHRQFPISTHEDETCRATLQRSAPPSTLNLSPMVAFPVGGRYDHPKLDPSNSFRKALRTWAESVWGDG